MATSRRRSGTQEPDATKGNTNPGADGTEEGVVPEDANSPDRIGKTDTDPDYWTGDPEDDPALADPDATGPTPSGPEDTDPDEEIDDEDDDLDVSSAEALDPDTEYVVLVDALNLKNGPKTSNTVRVHRGQIIKIKSQYPDVGYLLSIKAIAVNDGEPKKRTTAAALVAAAGAADDPVPRPSAGYVKDVTPEGKPTQA